MTNPSIYCTYSIATPRGIKWMTEGAVSLAMCGFKFQAMFRAQVRRCYEKKHKGLVESLQLKKPTCWVNENQQRKKKD